MSLRLTQAPVYFDGQICPSGLSDGDLRILNGFGLTAALATVNSTHVYRRGLTFLQSLDALFETQLPRMRSLGILSWAAVGIPPLAIPRRGFETLLASLPHYLSHMRAKAVGPLGLFHGTPMEESALSAQLRLARKLNLPAIVTTPSLHKEKLTRHILKLVKSSRLPAHRVLIQHANERTLHAILDAGHFAGLTIHPDALSAERALKLLSHSGSKRIVLNSNLGHAAGDLLGIPRMISRWNQTGLNEDIVHRACWTHISRFLKVTPRGWHRKND